MYYIVFFIGLILSIINDNRRISFKIFGIVLFVVAALRYGIGADYFAYNYLYTRLNPLIFSEIRFGLDEQEILFRLLGSVLKNFGLSYQQYLIVFSAINLYYIGKISRKYSENPTLSFFVYYCFYYFVWTFSGIRQGFVLAVGMYYLLECLESHNTKKIIFLSIFLSLIHLSAILLVVLYFLVRIKIDRNKMIILSCMAIAFSTIPIGNILTKHTMLPFVKRLLPYISYKSSIINILDFQSLGRIIFLIIGLFYYSFFSEKNELSKYIINIYIMSLLIYFLFKFSELTAARLSIYGAFLNIIILPNILYIYKDKFNKFLYSIMLCVLCSIYFNKELQVMVKQTGLVNSSIVVPYTNVYNKEKYIFDKRYLYYLKQ